MKRTLYTLLLTLTALLAAACSKHAPDTIQPETPSGSYIFFEPEVLTSVETRTTMVEGTSLPSAAGTAFGVVGYYASADPIFTHENYGAKHIANVQRESDGGIFSYAHLAQWKDATSTHNFYAFYPYSINDRVAADATSPYIRYQQPSNQNDMIDILTAKTSVTKSDLSNGLVPLTFAHRLWALDVSVKNSQTNDYVTSPEGNDVTNAPNLFITDAKIHIYGFREAGNITIGNNTVSGSTTTASQDEVITFYLFTASAATSSITIASAKSHSFDPLLFLPVSNTFAYRLEIKFKNAWGTSYDYYYPAPTTDADGNTTYGYQTLSKSFEAGKRYALEVEKIDAEGRFNINWTVQDWTEVDVEHTFN